MMRLVRVVVQYGGHEGLRGGGGGSGGWMRGEVGSVVDVDVVVRVDVDADDMARGNVGCGMHSRYQMWYLGIKRSAYNMSLWLSGIVTHVFVALSGG